MPLVQNLQHQYEDLLDGIPHALTIMIWVSGKGFYSLQRLAVCVDQFQSEVEREKKLELVRQGLRRRRWLGCCTNIIQTA
jgi:hypothetical protein